MKTRLARKQEDELQQVLVVQKKDRKGKVIIAQKQQEPQILQKNHNDHNQFDVKDKNEPQIKKKLKTDKRNECSLLKGKSSLFAQLTKEMNKQRNVTNKQIADITATNSITEQNKQSIYLDELDKDCLIDIRNKGIHINGPEEIIQKKEKLKAFDIEDNQSDVDETIPYEMILNQKALQMFAKHQNRRIHTQLPLRLVDYKYLLTSKPLVKDLILSWDYMNYGEQLRNFTESIQELQTQYKDFGCNNQGKLIKLEIDITKHIHSFKNQEKGRNNKSQPISAEHIKLFQINVFAFKRLRSLKLSFYLCDANDQVHIDIQEFISNIPTQLLYLRHFDFQTRNNIGLLIQTIEKFELNEKFCLERPQVIESVLIQYANQARFLREKSDKQSTGDWFTQFEYSIRSPFNDGFFSKQFKDTYEECMEFYRKRAPQIIEFKYQSVSGQSDPMFLQESADILKIIQTCSILKVLHLECTTAKIQNAYPQFSEFSELQVVDISIIIFEGSKKNKVLAKINNDTLEHHIRNLNQLVSQKNLVFKFKISFMNELAICHCIEIDRQQNLMTFELIQVQSSYLGKLRKIFAFVSGQMNINKISLKVFGFADESAHSQFFEVLSEMLFQSPQKLILELTYVHHTITDENNEKILEFFNNLEDKCRIFILNGNQIPPHTIQRILDSWIQNIIQLKGIERITLQFGAKVWSTLPYYKLQRYLQDCVNAQSDIELDFYCTYFGNMNPNNPHNNPHEQITRWKEGFLQSVQSKHIIQKLRLNRVVQDFKNGAIAEFVKGFRDQENNSPLPQQFIDQLLNSYYQVNEGS